MAKNKYNYEVTDINELEAFAPSAVRIEKKAVRSKITGMLAAGVKVPGIIILPEGTDTQKDGVAQEKKDDGEQKADTASA